jgi:hypothetical protein
MYERSAVVRSSPLRTVCTNDHDSREIGDIDIDVIDRMNQEGFSDTMNVFRPIQSEAVRVCNLVSNRDSIVHREHQCVGRLMITARMERIHAVQRLHEGFLARTGHYTQTRTSLIKEGLEYGHTYGFEALPAVVHQQQRSPSQSGSQPPRMDNVICMFGELDYRTMMIALAPAIAKSKDTSAASTTTKIQLVSEFLTDLDVIQAETVNEALSCRAEDSAQQFVEIVSLEKYLSRQQQSDRRCDAVYMNGGSYEQLVGLVAATIAQGVEPSIKEEQQDDNPLLVVWDSLLNFSKTDALYNIAHDNYNQMISESHNSSLIRWEAHVSWAYNTVLTYPTSKEGAFVKTIGMFLEYENNFVDVWMGTAARTRVLKPDSRVDDLGTVQAPSKSKLVTFIVSYSGEIFAPNAVAFKRALVSLGYEHSIVIPDIALEDIISIRSCRPTIYTSHLSVTSSQACEDRVFIQIVLGVFDPPLLLPHYIVYEPEQISRLSQDTSILHIHALTRAQSVLSFSQHHRNYLLSRGVSNVAVVPFYTYVNSSAQSALNVTPAIDILYFGGQSDRRLSLWPFLQPTMDVTLVHQFYHGSLESYVRDEERDSMVRGSKVIVNFHGCDPSSLALHRINYLLGMGKCVVSERSASDPALDAEYEQSGSVVFVDNVLDLFVVAAEYARDETRRRAVEAHALERYAAIHSNLTPFKEAIEQVISKVKA